MRYFTINKFSKIVGVTPQTLRNWDKAGKLKPHHTTEYGYSYRKLAKMFGINLETVCNIINEK